MIELFGALLGAIAAFGVPSWLRHRARHDMAATSHLERVGELASKLIADPEVPEPLVRFVRFSVSCSHNPRLARRLVTDVLSGRFEENMQSARLNPSPLHQLIRSLPSGRRDQVGELLAHVTLASASSDPVFAALTRRFVLWGFETGWSRKLETKKAQNVILVEAAYSRRHRGVPFPGFAAAAT